MIDTEVEGTFNRLLALSQDKTREVAALKEEVGAGEEEIELLKRCIEVFRTVANVRREKLKFKLESLLSYGLSAVFEEDLAVKMEYKKWGTSDRVYLFVGDKNVVTPLDKFRGGGLVEVVAFLIRLLVLVLYRPSQRRLFVGDEVFGAVRGDHLGELSLLIKQLTGRLGVQVILVALSTGLYEYADLVYEFCKVEGITICTELQG